MKDITNTFHNNVKGMTANSSHRRYMPGLDGLRALSVIAVVAYHLNLSWAQEDS